MNRATITILEEGRTGSPRTVSLQPGVTRIGRAADNNVVLKDPRVSRTHASIALQEDRYILDNTSARNPVLVNGHEVRRAELHDHDEISLGHTRLCFRLGAPDDGGATTLKKAALTLDAQNPDLILAGVDGEGEPALHRAKADLTSLYHAGRVISTSLSTSDLCEKTLQVILSEMKAVDCCSVHLITPDTGELQCKASRFRNPAHHEQPQTFSQGLLDKVLHEMKAVLTSNAQEDGRFETTQSIQSLQIRSAMCVPIQVQGRLSGVLQAHTLNPGHTFTADDLKLLTALGMMAGVAIQNAMLYENLDAEKTMQQEKAQLMQVMLHELKSPIAAARTMTMTLQSPSVTPELRERFLTRITSRLDGMLEWIRETLDLSQLKTGERKDEPVLLDLAATLRELCESYREQAAAKHLDFTVEIPPEPVQVRMDPRGLRMVLSNLVSNAVKYTVRGTVSVALTGEEDSAAITVRDTGIGIPEKELPQLYGEFFRASNARKSGFEGSGVGLAGVRLIVERTGGTIDVTSRENEGTTFLLRLPLADLAASDTTG